MSIRVLEWAPIQCRFHTKSRMDFNPRRLTYTHIVFPVLSNQSPPDGSSECSGSSPGTDIDLDPDSGALAMIAAARTLRPKDLKTRWTRPLGPSLGKLQDHGRTLGLENRPDPGMDSGASSRPWAHRPKSSDAQAGVGTSRKPALVGPEAREGRKVVSRCRWSQRLSVDILSPLLGGSASVGRAGRRAVGPGRGRRGRGGFGGRGWSRGW